MSNLLLEIRERNTLAYTTNNYGGFTLGDNPISSGPLAFEVWTQDIKCPCCEQITKFGKRITEFTTREEAQEYIDFKNKGMV